MCELPIKPVDAGDFKESIQDYLWPGNIRELENIIERAAIFCEGSDIEPRDIVLAEGAEAKPPEPRSLRALERDAIRVALYRWDGNRTRAAEELGISRRTLLYKIKLYRIEG